MYLKQNRGNEKDKISFVSVAQAEIIYEYSLVLCNYSISYELFFIVRHNYWLWDLEY